MISERKATALTVEDMARRAGLTDVKACFDAAAPSAAGTQAGRL